MRYNPNMSNKLTLSDLEAIAVGIRNYTFNGYIDDAYRVTASAAGIEIGWLEWTSKEISLIYVRPEVRRQGLATGMYLFALETYSQGETYPLPSHSACMTSDGLLWAVSTKDPIPPQEAYTLR